MVTAVPTGPDEGVNDVIDGGTRKFMPTLFAVPPGVVTKMIALSNPAGTRAVICVSESTVKLDAGTVPKLTSVAPVRPVPVMVTAVPTGPDAGVNDVIVGGGGGGGGLPVSVKRAKPDCGTPENAVKKPPTNSALSVICIAHEPMNCGGLTSRSWSVRAAERDRLRHPVAEDRAVRRVHAHEPVGPDAATARGELVVEIAGAEVPPDEQS